MKWTKSSTGTKAFLLGAAFLLLFLSPLSLSAQSSSASGSDAEDLIYQACQEIVKAHPDMKPQIGSIAKSLRQIAERQMANSQALQTTIDGQATKIAGLQTTIDAFPTLLENSTISHIKVEDDLKRYADSLKTGLIVNTTIGIVSILLNVGQAIAYQIK